MESATDLVFAEEIDHLREVASGRNWPIKVIDGPGFELVLPARDGSEFLLRVMCDQYPSIPPAWRWGNASTGTYDQPVDTPKGSGYFHGSGRICAPWNRLAYKEVDNLGPHADWQLSTWMTNTRTGGCTTLTAMVLRTAVELKSSRYQGRQA